MFDNMRYLKRELLKFDDRERRKLAGYIAQEMLPSRGFGIRWRFGTPNISVMNNRGLDLSPTDVLKAVVLDAISDSQSRMNTPSNGKRPRRNSDGTTLETSLRTYE